MTRSTSVQKPTTIPTGWKAIQLSEVAQVIGGGRLKLTKQDYVEKGYPAFSAAGQDGYVKPVEFNANGVILSSIGARCGKCFLATGEWTTLANTQIILPDEKVCDVRYLWHYVNDEAYWHRSGSAQPFIKPSDVKGAWLLLPPLAEQKRIAAVLGAVSEGMQRARELLESLQVLRDGLGADVLSGKLRVPET